MLEAMTVGVPVVAAFDAGALPEVGGDAVMRAADRLTHHGRCDRSMLDDDGAAKGCVEKERCASRPLQLGTHGTDDARGLCAGPSPAGRNGEASPDAHRCGRARSSGTRPVLPYYWAVCSASGRERKRRTARDRALRASTHSGFARQRAVSARRRRWNSVRATDTRSCRANDKVDVLFSPAYSTPHHCVPRVVARNDISFAARSGSSPGARGAPARNSPVALPRRRAQS